MASTLPLPLPPQNPTPPPKTIITKPPTFRSRLSQLCKDGRPDLARRLLLDRPIPSTSTVLWNTVLIGLVCNGLPEDALRFLSLMSPASVRPDHYTFSSALKACADSNQLRLGRSIHARILRRYSRPNRILSNSLLNMYSSCGCPQVQLLFDRMRARNAVAWNTVIAWHARNARLSDAVVHFRRLLESGTAPTPVSFVNVFPAVACLDRALPDAVHALLLKFGGGFVGDPFVASSAVAMYSEILDIDSARKVFDRTTLRNTEVWNTMIGACVQNELPREALDLYLQIFESKIVSTDSVTLITVLMAVSQLQSIEYGRQIHALVMKSAPMDSPVALSNALVVMYSRCGEVETAFRLFDEMSERDVVTWNTMVSAFVQNGFDSEGLMLVRAMQKKGFTVDPVAAMALLSAASNLGDSRIGRETHAYVFRRGIRFEGMNSYLIDMYSKSGLIETAKRLFEEADGGGKERDQVTWNAMIAGYAQSGHAEQALASFQEMIGCGEAPNSVTLSSVLPACTPYVGAKMGRQIHGFAVRRSLDDNVYVGTALLDMYAKCGGIDYAERVFHLLREKNSVTHTTMISGYGQHGLGEKALSLFYAMRESDIKPDSITLVAVMSACSYSGLVDKGLEIFDTMEAEFGIRPSIEHYSCVVDVLGRAGKVEEAYEFARDLDEGVRDSIAIWGPLLSACRVHGKLELAKRVAERVFEMEEDGRSNVVGYHVLASNVHALKEEWESVDRVRRRMREKGMRKEPGLSWVGVRGSAHRFMSRDRRNDDQESIYSVLDELATEMRRPRSEPVVKGLLPDGPW